MWFLGTRYSKTCIYDLNSEHWTLSNQLFCCSVIFFSIHTQFLHCWWWFLSYSRENPFSYSSFVLVSFSKFFFCILHFMLHMNGGWSMDTGHCHWAMGIYTNTCSARTMSVPCTLCVFSCKYISFYIFHRNMVLIIPFFLFFCF